MRKSNDEIGYAGQADDALGAANREGANYTPVQRDEGFLHGQEPDSRNPAEQAAGTVEADLPPNIPSSLNVDRRASAARTGRAELDQRLQEHTETSPGLTGGDVDADWQSAYSVGDEAPGGDNPTPDQDVVDEIGRALGVEYQDNEELKGAEKIADRDRRRWELDPASSDDWEDRNNEKE